MTKQGFTAEKNSEIPTYVADLVAQLRQLVPGERYRDLRYLLDMARMEAEQHAQQLSKMGKN